MDAQEAGWGMDWIWLRIRTGALINAVMNILVA
jgi:hypothetical protein